LLQLGQSRVGISFELVCDGDCLENSFRAQFGAIRKLVGYGKKGNEGEVVAVEKGYKTHEIERGDG